MSGTGLNNPARPPLTVGPAEATREQRMLFNSYVFILAFLPVVLAVYYSLGGLGQFNGAVAWLLLASLFFYGWWNPTYLLLLMGSLDRKRTRLNSSHSSAPSMP